MGQEPTDVDPDLWTDEGELTELPDIPVGDGDRVLREMCMDPVNPEVIAVPDLENSMIFDSLEEREMREKSTRGDRWRYTMRIRREHFKLKRGWMYLWDGMKPKI